MSGHATTPRAQSKVPDQPHQPAAVSSGPQKIAGKPSGSSPAGQTAVTNPTKGAGIDPGYGQIPGAAQTAQAINQQQQAATAMQNVASHADNAVGKGPVGETGQAQNQNQSAFQQAAAMAGRLNPFTNRNG